MTTDQLFSSKEVAQILGVNESSVKRWADSEKIKCVRTPGGHRKFRLEDINDFVRSSHLGPVPVNGHLMSTQSENELLPAIRSKNYAFIVSHFYRTVLIANGQEIFDFMNVLGLHDFTTLEIFDKVLQPVMVRIGEEWAAGRLTVDEEHAATAALFDALIRLQISSTKLPKKNRRVLLAVLENDFHQLVIKCFSILLENNGWQVYYLGANSPIFSIENALHRTNPQVLLVSSTITPANPELITDQITAIGKSLHENGSKLVIGGSGLSFWKDRIPTLDFWGTSFTDTIYYLESLRFEPKDLN